MEEYINILDYLDEDNLQETLTEATAYNKVVDVLPDGERLDILDEDAREWNEYFIKYRNYRPEPLFVIKVENLSAKGNGANLARKEGYLVYTGETQYQAGKRFHRGKTLIDPSKIQVVENQKDATLFTNEDAKTMISAIRGDKNLSRGRFSIISATKDQTEDVDPAKSIFRAFIIKVAGSDMILDFLRDAENTIYQICRPLGHPLVGNGYLEIFTNAFKKEVVKDNWRVSHKIAIMINNLIADRVVSSAELKDPRTFVGSLLLTNNIYNSFKADDIEKIINLYKNIKEKGYNGVENKLLAEWEKEHKGQIARNCILAVDDADLFKKVVENNIDKKGVEDQLPLLPYTPDKALYDAIVRTPEVIDKLRAKIYPNAAREENEWSFFIVKKDSEGELKSIECDSEEEADGDVTLKFNSIKFNAGDSFKLIHAIVGENIRAKWKQVDILTPSIEWAKEFKWLKGSETDPVTVVENAGSKSIVCNIVLTRNKTYKVSEIIFKEAGYKTEEPKKEKQNIEPESGTEEPEINTSGSIMIAGKTLDEIVAMNQQNLERFKSSLSQEDIKKLAAYGRKFIFKA